MDHQYKICKNVMLEGDAEEVYDKICLTMVLCFKKSGVLPLGLIDLDVYLFVEIVASG